MSAADGGDRQHSNTCEVVSHDSLDGLLSALPFTVPYNDTVDLGSLANGNCAPTRVQLEAKLQGLRTSVGEHIGLDDVTNALRMLEYARRYEPDRVLDDSFPWMRVLNALRATGIDVARLDASASSDDHDIDAIHSSGVVAEPKSNPALPTLPEQPELNNLRASGLTNATIQAAGLETWRGERIDNAVAWPLSRSPRVHPDDPTTVSRSVELVGLAIPCMLAGSREPYAFRFRLRHPRGKKSKETAVYEYDADGRVKSIKYESPRRMSPPIYYGPHTREAKALRDPSATLIFTEGEKKACVSSSATSQSSACPASTTLTTQPHAAQPTSAATIRRPGSCVARLSSAWTCTAASAS